MKTMVVTGADGGIGAALCDVWGARGATVIASCLANVSEAKGRPGVELVTGVDVTTAAGVRKLCECVGDRMVDVLVSNAGLVIERGLGAFDYDAFHLEFAVNALAPLRLTEALLPKMRAGSKIGIVTSRLASLGENESGGLYGYRMSKAAANMAGLNLAHELKGRGIAVICLHPGSVRTQMATTLVDQAALGALVSPLVAAERLIARLEELTIEDTGAFRHANGQVLPW